MPETNMRYSITMLRHELAKNLIQVELCRVSLNFRNTNETTGGENKHVSSADSYH